MQGCIFHFYHCLFIYLFIVSTFHIAVQLMCLSSRPRFTASTVDFASEEWVAHILPSGAYDQRLQEGVET